MLSFKTVIFVLLLYGHCLIQIKVMTTIIKADNVTTGELRSLL